MPSRNNTIATCKQHPTYDGRVSPKETDSRGCATCEAIHWARNRQQRFVKRHREQGW
jgi:hypothetical protein